MLRLHFTEPDLRRVRLADDVDPLWETVLSLHQLQTREGALAFDGWRALARSWAGDRKHRTMLAMLGAIAPRRRYFPDFLTPEQARAGLDAGLDAILATPRDRLETELRATYRGRGRQAPRWIVQLATGARDMRQLLVQLLRTYHSDLVLPYAPTSEPTVAADRARRAQALLAHGIDGLCGTFGPHARWERNVLQLPYPNDKDLHLDGRGVTLVPSFYCWRTPVALADQALAPVLVYPVEHEPRSWCPASDDERVAGLGALLGCTRAEVLRAVARGATPGRLRRTLGIAPSVVTHHTSILRQAGLITTVRDGRWVVHEVTPLGRAVLDGAGLPGPGPAG
ncbi:ArsR/SmtB family transcription factor [Promicromonospora sp. NPDC057488]|uniref:ArsR/SmtB family transcription factor n=1 Tax=Promicromonospora sp. NPDC057488 TaxID=3346147 RepID=UPI00366D6984